MFLCAVDQQLIHKQGFPPPLLDFRPEGLSVEPRVREAIALCDSGEVSAAAERCSSTAEDRPEGRFWTAVGRAQFLLESGEAGAALQQLDRIKDDGPAGCVDLGRGAALFELGRWVSAELAYRSALSHFPKLADAYFGLALTAEACGSDEQDVLFRRARTLDPERFGPAPQVSRTVFEAAVRSVRDELSEDVSFMLESLELCVKELPSNQDLFGARLGISPRTAGLCVRHRSEKNFDGGHLMLFKRNIERMVSPKSDLERCLRRTIVQLASTWLELRVTSKARAFRPCLD